tara:strand:+ start:571 stop:1524 length:954 start_codon:yes stop_codon:yes gene_type:complete
MNLKRLITNILLSSISISFGIIVCEFAGRSFGLGNPLLYKEDELVGYRLRPNQNKKRLKNSFVSTDFEGFRFDPNQKKDLSAEIIIFVGDSVTYGGSYIDNSNLFSSIYCDDSTNLVCLNSGVNSWGTYNMGRFISNFSLYSTRIPSKFVLIILPGDDLRNLSQLSSLPYWSASPKHPKAINELLNYSLLRYIVPSLRSQNLEFNKDVVKESNIKSQTIKQSWQDLDNYIKSSESKVEIVLTPPKRWFEKSQQSQSDIKLYDQYLSMISQNQNVLKTCNLYYFVRDDYSSIDYVDSVHLSNSGHKKWAKYIKSCLSQ